MNTHEKAVEVCQKIKLPTSGPAYVWIQSALEDCENQYSARIAELEAQAAQQWQPLTGKEWVKDIDVELDGAALDIGVIDNEGDSVWYRVILPDDIRLCRKVQL